MAQVQFKLNLYLKQFHTPNLTVYCIWSNVFSLPLMAEWVMIPPQRILLFYQDTRTRYLIRHQADMMGLLLWKKYMDFIYSVRYLRRALTMKATCYVSCTMNKILYFLLCAKGTTSPLWCPTNIFGCACSQISCLNTFWTFGAKRNTLLAWATVFNFLY